MTGEAVSDGETVKDTCVSVVCSADAAGLTEVPAVCISCTAAEVTAGSVKEAFSCCADADKAESPTAAAPAAGGGRSPPVRAVPLYPEDPG